MLNSQGFRNKITSAAARANHLKKTQIQLLDLQGTLYNRDLKIEKLLLLDTGSDNTQLT